MRALPYPPSPREVVRDTLHGETRELEGRPRVMLDAHGLEDELRLRAWLRAAERRLGRAIVVALARATR